MGPRGRGVIDIASGVKTPDELEPMVAKHGRPFFQGTGVAMYNEQAPERAIRIFEDCAAAIRRGNGLYIQIPCQPLSFDFTMANAYPFYSHSAFDPIKAYAPEQLKEVFRDTSWRAKFRENAKNPRPGMIFQGNWDRVMVAVTHKPGQRQVHQPLPERDRRGRASRSARHHARPQRSTRISRPRSSAASSMSATTAWRGC